MVISVKIGEFRNHLSAYLHKIRQGAEVIINDRETPVGRLIPVARRGEHDELKMIEPQKGYRGLFRLSFSPCIPPILASEELLKERRAR